MLWALPKLADSGQCQLPTARLPEFVDALLHRMADSVQDAKAQVRLAPVCLLGGGGRSSGARSAHHLVGAAQL